MGGGAGEGVAGDESIMLSHRWEETRKRSLVSVQQLPQTSLEHLMELWMQG